MPELYRVRYWYPAEPEGEVVLPNTPVKLSKKLVAVGPGHLLFDDVRGPRLMCNRPRSALRREHAARHEVVLDKRARGSAVCQKCLDAWKNHDSSEWKKWKGKT